MKKATCLRCNEPFLSRGLQQKFCGSKGQKNGCSWLNIQERRKVARRNFADKNPSYDSIVSKQRRTKLKALSK